MTKGNSNEGVLITTIHQSKGREFVFSTPVNCQRSRKTSTRRGAFVDFVAATSCANQAFSVCLPILS